MLEEIFQDALKGIAGDRRAQLLGAIEGVVQSLVLHDVSNVIAHNLLKAVDGIVAAAVQVVDSPTATKLAKAYNNHVDQQLIEMVNALDDYIPYQVKVESMKHLHGSDSAEANAARKEREPEIKKVHAAVDAVFNDLVKKKLNP